MVPHHSGLIDVYDENGNYNLSKRLGKSFEQTFYRESLEKFEFREETEVLEEAAFRELSDKITEIKNNKNFCGEAEKYANTRDFYFGMLTRMLFSCLIRCRQA
ncbi:MAG: hypothetical protein LBD73_07580 [Deferribacteraceae bacterium]|nr:hypothetical protein [Deferribacteraceae bacterium]